MKITLILLPVILVLSPLAVSVQAETERAKYCWAHPNDSAKCNAIPTINEDGKKEVLGIPAVCGGDTRHAGILGLLQYEGMDEDSYERSGLCKLTADEYGSLFTWHLSRLASRVYFRTDKNRPGKRIYVSTNFERDTPEVLKSAFRSHLRAIPDLELVEGSNGDIVVRILAVSTTHNGLGEKTAYAVSVLSLVIWNKPGYPVDQTLEEVKSGLILVFPIEGIDSNVRDAVASIDNDVFEDFRKTWPYDNPGVK